MTAENYNACLAKVLEREGGYTTNSADPGNWTGGECGVGECKGTNKGISAASYPSLDIENLTIGEVADIYKADYWLPCGGDELPAGVDLCCFDGSVNSGTGKGVLWLQEAMDMPDEECDGAYGPITRSYVEAITDPHHVIDGMCGERLAFMMGLSTWPTFGAGWAARVDDIRRTAHLMVEAPPDAPEKTLA